MPIPVEERIASDQDACNLQVTPPERFREERVRLILTDSLTYCRSLDHEACMALLEALASNRRKLPLGR